MLQKLNKFFQLNYGFRNNKKYTNNKNLKKLMPLLNNNMAIIITKPIPPKHNLILILKSINKILDNHKFKLDLLVQKPN